MNWIMTYDGSFLNLEHIGRLSVIGEDGYFSISAWFPAGGRSVEVWKYPSCDEASKDLKAFFTDSSRCEFMRKSMGTNPIESVTDVSGRCC